jgi:hypothetical protein
LTIRRRKKTINKPESSKALCRVTTLTRARINTKETSSWKRNTFTKPALRCNLSNRKTKRFIKREAQAYTRPPDTIGIKLKETITTEEAFKLTLSLSSTMKG